MLCNLPREVISEIASHLSYRDVVVLCKALAHGNLCDAPNSHVVWLNLATQYVAEHPHSQLANTPCLSSLSTDQLRLRFEKRLLVNEIWQLPREVYPLVKRLKYPSTSILTVKIAPGGRWVFGGTDNLTVCYWDLDSDNPEPFVLVPRDRVGDIPGRHCSVVEMDFAVEHGDPLSGFTIAFVGCDYDLDYSGKSREWLYIWDVKVQEDSTLEAKHLKALPMPYAGWNPCLSFNEHMAARYLEYETYRLDVYWWKDCTETHLTRCTIEFQRGSFVFRIFVLGRDKILVYTGHHNDIHKVRLYAMEPAYSEIGEGRKVLPTATEVWSLRFLCDYNGSQISELYFDGTNYSQTIAMLDGIFKLTIPAPQANEPTLARVSDFDLYQRQYEGTLYGLGLNKGYCKAGQTLYRFGYSKRPTMEVYESGAKLDPDLDRILQCLSIYHSFDEETGRLVSRCMGYLIFQDFSLPLYNAVDASRSADPSLEKKALSWWNWK